MPYPNQPAARDAWILARRGPREPVDAQRPHGSFVERERAHDGAILDVGTVLLTNRECPWRCLMCDLWKRTLPVTVSPGIIPRQIDQALREWQSAGHAPRQIKLYNSGSFFDPRAIPLSDHADIAARVRHFERVVVECHPALVGDRAVRFRDELNTTLEVAMGLETIHPDVLPRLNKRMTPDQFARAAGFLQAHGLELRVFVLLQPPFLPATDAVAWAVRSMAFAFDCGATAVSLIPTRAGNGALEALAADGQFSPPSLADFEHALDQALTQFRGRGRVFGDLWDLATFSRCPSCLPARRARLEQMNLHQELTPRVRCPRRARCPEDIT